MAAVRAASGPDFAAIRAVGETTQQAAYTAWLLEGLLAYEHGHSDSALWYLEWVAQSAHDHAATLFVDRYMPNWRVTLPVVQGITVSLPLARESAILALAELRQAEGQTARAIQLVETLDLTTIAALSLAELYLERDDRESVIEMTNGLENVDDASMYLLIARATALVAESRRDAAREVLKAALAPRSRPMELRHLALRLRAQTYLDEGKRSLARKDLEKILAENASFPGLAELLADAPPE